MTLGEAQRLKVISTIRQDVKFLTKQGLMDYSLLMGIETLTEGEGRVSFKNRTDSEVVHKAHSF